ncbi:MAG: universal stress protein [Nevskia sp.]
MSEYQHILVAVEANDDGRRLLIRANALAQRFRARLSILHVVQYLPLDAGNGMMLPAADLSGEMIELARGQLLHWCTELELDPASLHLTVDNVKSGIIHHAETYGVDLILVGHHQRHGLAALFSHTEEGVLSRAACDVLAVAITPQKQA